MRAIAHNSKRLRYAVAGIFYAIHNDYSYRMQWYFGSVALVVFWYIVRDISATEWLFLLLAWFLILITELQNTAFEAALDHLHPELHDQIGRSKDMAAGAVLSAAVFLVIVMVTIFFG